MEGFVIDDNICSLVHDRLIFFISHDTYQVSEDSGWQILIYKLTFMYYRRSVEFMSTFSILQVIF